MDVLVPMLVDGLGLLNIVRNNHEGDVPFLERGSNVKRNRLTLASHIAILFALAAGVGFVHVALAYGRITSASSLRTGGAAPSILASPSSPIFLPFYWRDLDIGAGLLCVATFATFFTYRAEALDGRRASKLLRVTFATAILLVAMGLLLGTSGKMAYWDWLSFALGVAFYLPTIFDLATWRRGKQPDATNSG